MILLCYYLCYDDVVVVYGGKQAGTLCSKTRRTSSMWRENFVNALIKVRHPIKTNLHHHPLSLSHSSQNAEEQTTINYFFELIKINVSTFEEMRKGIY